MRVREEDTAHLYPRPGQNPSRFPRLDRAMGNVVNVVAALVAAYLIFKIGFALLGSFARPAPEPPPPGEMRRVNLTYRCPLCGMELRVREAISEDPIPPRHCMDEMELVAPAD